MFCSCVGPVCSILAIIFSLIGLSQVNRRPDLYGGKSFAIAGKMVIAILALVFYIVMITIFGFASALSPDGATHHDYKL